MDVAGISPENRPGPKHREVAPEADDRKAALHWMLAPLRALPGVYVSEPPSDHRDLCELTIEMELDARAPHIDFLAQLLALVRRILGSRGVVVPVWIVKSCEQLAAQASSQNR